jgi:hypothetical protein
MPGAYGSWLNVGHKRLPRATAPSRKGDEAEADTLIRAKHHDHELHDVRTGLLELIPLGAFATWREVFSSDWG